MKLQSKLFDTIRIRPRREEKPEPVDVVCDWEGCEEPGEFKAPKGVRSEGQYHNFCLEHVRHYNKAFNYFAGMSPEELEEALHAPPKAESRSSFATGNPGAARRLHDLLVAEGRRYADTPRGARLRDGLAVSESVENLRRVWEIVSLNALGGPAAPSGTPDAWADLLVDALVGQKIDDTMLARLRPEGFT